VRTDPLDYMFVQSADVYHLDQSEETDGQLVEGYPDTPDIDDLACLIGDTDIMYLESDAGVITQMTALMYCKGDADIQVRDRIEVDGKTYYVAGQPRKIINPWLAGHKSPWVLEVELQREIPG